MQPALGRTGAPPAESSGAGDPPTFGVGRAIGRTFSTWWRHAWAFSLLTLLSSLPLWAGLFLSGLPVPGVTVPQPNPFDPAALAAASPAPGTPSAAFWLGYLGTMLLFLVEVGAITHGVIHHLAGKRVSLGAMLGAGARRALPLLAVGVLCYVLVVLGTLLLVVPGVYVACALAAAMPAVVVERPGVFGAVKRSFAVTKGKRFAVFLVFLVLGAVATGAMVFGNFVLPALTAPLSPLVGVVAGALLNLFLGTLVWVAPGVVYHDLRVAKEGVATAELAAVFE